MKSDMMSCQVSSGSWTKEDSWSPVVLCITVSYVDLRRGYWLRLVVYCRPSSVSRCFASISLYSILRALDRQSESYWPAYFSIYMSTHNAFLFVKPHAADSEAAVELVESMLNAAGITITSSGVLEASVIDEKKLIGKLYAQDMCYASPVI